MIIATIGNTKYQLETLKDAETLLDIIHRSTLVEQTCDAEYREYAYIATGQKRVNIEITDGNTILTRDEHLARQAESLARKEKKAAEKAAA